MLLEELTTADLDFLAKALSQLRGAHGWEELDRFAYNAKALDEAVTLYNWAIESGGDFGKEYEAFSHLIAGRSMAGTRSALRVLEKTGFIGRNRVVDVLATESIVGSPASFRNARQEAMPFIKAVRSLFYSLKVLGDVATPTTYRSSLNDGLTQKIAGATLKKLGVRGDNLMVKA